MCVSYSFCPCWVNVLCVFLCTCLCICKFMSWLTFPDERASIRVWGVRTCLVCPCWACQLNVVKRFLNDRVSKSTMFHTIVWYCGHQQCATCVRIPKLANSKIYYYCTTNTEHYTKCRTDGARTVYTSARNIYFTHSAVWNSVIQLNPMQLNRDNCHSHTADSHDYIWAGRQLDQTWSPVSLEIWSNFS